MNKRLLILIFSVLMTTAIYQGYATTAQDCRNCHGTDLSTRHHLLVNEGKYGCPDCHPSPINNSQWVERDCLVCHTSESVGDIHEDCIGCHGTNYTGASPSVTSTFVNISAFNESVHQDINATPPATLNNQDCWMCHYYKDMNRLNVKKCGDCHMKPSQWHGNANITTNLSELW